MEHGEDTADGEARVPVDWLLAGLLGALACIAGVWPAEASNAEPVALVVQSRNPDSGVPIAVVPPDLNGADDGQTQFDRLYETGTLVTLTAPLNVGSNSFQQWLRYGEVYSYSPAVQFDIRRDVAFAAVYESPPPPPSGPFHVDAARPDDSGDGLSWPTAKRTIQAAVDLADAGSVVWVTNGVYAEGARPVMLGGLANRVVIDKAITLRSVNGPDVTLIEGAAGYPEGMLAESTGIVRCVYMTAGRIEGFTLTNGWTRGFHDGEPMDHDGGGASGTGGTLTNCVIVGCGARHGGGAYGVTLHDCLVTANHADGEGGGAYDCSLADCVVSKNLIVGMPGEVGGGGTTLCTLSNCLIVSNRSLQVAGGTVGGSLVNCTVVGNRATEEAGGTASGSLLNCIVYHNTSDNSSVHNTWSGTINYTCTYPPPPAGTGNITNDPQLTPAFRLLCTSPCIDAGTTNGAPATDADGEARWDHPDHSNVVSIADMGWDEFVDRDLDCMADAWEIESFGDTNHNADADDDSDLLDNLGEYEHGTRGDLPDTEGDGMWDGWEVGHGLDPLADDASQNPDGDPHDNGSEFVADTDPHDSNSVLRVLGIAPESGGTRLDWHGGRDSWQWVERSTNLLDADAWDWFVAFPPPTPRTNAVVLHGQTNSPCFFRIRAER